MRFPRSSGILLHPTSLPGPFGSGDLGAESYKFIDLLLSTGQSLWQMLPIGPAGMANSPYMSLSAFAGSPLFIDLCELVSHGWLTHYDLDGMPHFSDQRVNYPQVTTARMAMLAKAAKNFFLKRNEEDSQQFETYCSTEKSWLEDYSLFQALNDRYDGNGWISWDHDLVHRNAHALKNSADEFREYVNFHKFTQWCFARQWNKMRKYANERNVKLVGDIPIFVAHHSADVWSNQEAFFLDKDGMPTVVAGVPPDYFSEDGQRWGNPLYRWNKMKEQKYRWWIERFRKTFELFDIIRIDHFRGFEAYWEIPAKEKTARIGRWVKGPGENLFKAVKRELGTLPIIAEDLGVITPEVVALREKFGFPGMKVLQFAFSTGPEDNFLPHTHEKNYVVFTGTHDNDTTLGWYDKATEQERDFVKRYCGTDGQEINWDLIKLALQSVADIAVIPLQDVIGLGSDGRMNFPGTIEGNWEWRFTWDKIESRATNKLYKLTELYGRCKPDRLNRAAEK
ncbi:MAG: 4-alpha-glucanotransferase [Bacteroidota bacterium]